MSLKPINSNVVFEFLDKTIKKNGNRQFQTTTNSGIVLQSFDDGTKENRWGIIKAIGPDVKSDLKIGDTILVEALKWTQSFSVDNETVWLTTEDCILLVKEED